MVIIITIIFKLEIQLWVVILILVVLSYFVMKYFRKCLLFVLRVLLPFAICVVNESLNPQNRLGNGLTTAHLGIDSFFFLSLSIIFAAS